MVVLLFVLKTAFNSQSSRIIKRGNAAMNTPSANALEIQEQIFQKNSLMKSFTEQILK